MKVAIEGDCATINPLEVTSGELITLTTQRLPGFQLSFGSASLSSGFKVLDVALARDRRGVPQQVDSFDRGSGNFGLARRGIDPFSRSSKRFLFALAPTLLLEPPALGISGKLRTFTRPRHA